MAFSIPKISYTGTIKEVTLGTGASAVSVGGEGCYPFYVFEGAMPQAAPHRLRGVGLRA